MSKSQLASLNSNIPAKNRKIKSIYKSMKKVKVYFKVEVYSKDMSECLYETNDLDSKTAKAVWNELLASEKYMDAVKQLVRYQSSGYVGGIILGGHRDVLQNVAC